MGIEMDLFKFKLFELYQHTNSYSIIAATLEEAVSKAISGEVEVADDDWDNGFVCTVGGEDDDQCEAIDHPEFVNYRLIKSSRLPKAIYARRRKSYMARARYYAIRKYGDIPEDELQPEYIEPQAHIGE